MKIDLMKCRDLVFDGVCWYLVVQIVGTTAYLVQIPFEKVHLYAQVAPATHHFPFPEPELDSTSLTSQINSLVASTSS